MSISINIPEELYKQARAIADDQDLPVEEVFANAFTEQFYSWKRLQDRAGRGDRDRFIAVLDKVADVEPEDCDAA